MQRCAKFIQQNLLQHHTVLLGSLKGTFCLLLVVLFVHLNSFAVSWGMSALEISAKETSALSPM